MAWCNVVRHYVFDSDREYNTFAKKSRFEDEDVTARPAVIPSFS